MSRVIKVSLLATCDGRAASLLFMTQQSFSFISPTQFKWCSPTPHSSNDCLFSRILSITYLSENRPSLALCNFALFLQDSAKYSYDLFHSEVDLDMNSLKRATR